MVKSERRWASLIEERRRTTAKEREILTLEWSTAGVASLEGGTNMATQQLAHEDYADQGQRTNPWKYPRTYHGMRTHSMHIW